jgi:hypothetical protein
MLVSRTDLIARSSLAGLLAVAAERAAAVPHVGGFHERGRLADDAHLPRAKHGDVVVPVDVTRGRGTLAAAVARHPRAIDHQDHVVGDAVCLATQDHAPSPFPFQIVVGFRQPLDA